MYGIWHGKDATVAVTDGFSISFLRLSEDNIACVLRVSDRIAAVVYGYGIGYNTASDFNFITPDGKEFSKTSNSKALFDNHSVDSFETVGEKMIYRTFDGKEFELELAEEFDPATYFTRRQPAIGECSVAEAMAKWNVYEQNWFRDSEIEFGFSTEKHGIYFNIDAESGTIYCRVGLHGYCEKGWAMLSTTCVRANECHMIPDNRDAKKPYHPDESCFVENGCAFPRDGGWYWSLKEVTEDVIRLNGCGDVTYEIYRMFR